MALQCWTSHALFVTFTQPKNHGRIHDVIRIPRKAPKFTCLVNIGLADIAEVAHNKVFFLLLICWVLNFLNFSSLLMLSKVLVAAAVSAAIGQLSKPVTSVILYGKDFNFRTAFQAGGFPSTHSSSVVATATSLAIERGFSDSIFGLSLVYAGLVMYDAQGVRREVGNHAKALNTVLPKGQVTSVVSKNRDDLIVSRDESVATLNVERLGSLVITSDKEVSQTNEAMASSELAADDEGSESNAYKPLIPLKESIGHTEVEVVAGALLGFLVSLAVYSIM
ncbi:PREDICTED: uncharacterized membrane protein YuiD isoform X1 [Theobroma cacao]|uniref:Uncharacterized membrane protein YuiD isoform X1 n=1 Tax=Theobroma cacao TaxID=3641 RepID=A0AB32WR05_THECC|nr:PREDICTED: uncharacterized membrane protein YuiD isoform X1 [Theobroma cacao]